MKKITVLLFLTLFLSAALSAQEILTLEQCVQIANANSIALKQSEYRVQNDELTLKENKYSRLPNLNGSAGLGINFGRTLDATTNRISTESVKFNNFGLTSGVSLFAGGRIANSVKQSDSW